MTGRWAKKVPGNRPGNRRPEGGKPPQASGWHDCCAPEWAPQPPPNGLCIVAGAAAMSSMAQVTRSLRRTSAGRATRGDVGGRLDKSGASTVTLLQASFDRSLVFQGEITAHRPDGSQSGTGR